MLRSPSKHFSWAEANPHGFTGFNFAVRVRVVAQARRMEKLRDAINKRRLHHNLKPTGIHVLSWWRPDWYNKQIHGARFSRHIKGDACDISLQEIRRLMPWEGGQLEFDRLCESIWPDGGFGTYPAGDRHTDCRGYKARWSSFTRQ